VHLLLAQLVVGWAARQAGARDGSRLPGAWEGKAMKADELQRDVRELHEFAFDLRVKRNSMVSKYATLPASVTKSLRDASQAVDDAASDLLNAYGQPMPKDAF